ncbi:MAG: TonB-dependent receptor [Sinimarinibacterium flocculans]|uniref:TonB-dependent receptor n=1 Tax=Sinimarinibacterium flocculans TaxID=985250 RepID=UPI003C33122A
MKLHLRAMAIARFDDTPARLVAVALLLLSLQTYSGAVFADDASASSIDDTDLDALINGAGVPASPAEQPHEPQPQGDDRLATIKVGPPERSEEALASPRRRQLEEIVVTAQRREESLQDVPVSVTAFSGDFLMQRDITSFSSVAHLTPGFVFSQQFGQVSPTIRGIGADRFSLTSEPGVALYVDDIYYGRPFLPQAALSSVERIEVLKGPQGTLYGRNAEGGALKIVTRRPSDDLEGTFSAQYGSFNRRAANGSLSGPLWGSLRGLAAFAIEDHDGYIENRTLDRTVEAHEVRSGHVSFLADPADWLTLRLSANRSQQYDTGPTPHATTPVTFGVAAGSLAVPIFHPYDAYLAALEQAIGPLDTLRRELLGSIAGGRTSHDPRVVSQDLLSWTRIKSSAASFSADATGEHVEGRLILGHLSSRRNLSFDGDMTDFAGLHFVDPTFTTGRQWSAELQLSGDADLHGLGSLRWLVGGFAFDEAGTERLTMVVVGLGQADFSIPSALIAPSNIPLLQHGALTGTTWRTRQDVRSYAAFADLEWEPLAWLRVHLGQRFTEDRKLGQRSVEHPDPGQACEDERQEVVARTWTPRAGLDVFFSDGNMLYASLSRGFKSGGSNLLACGAPPYDPEWLDAYELGLKSAWFGGLLQINAAVFAYQYSGIQIETVVGLSTRVENAAQGRAEGFELQVVALPLDVLKIDASVAYLNARYEDYMATDPFQATEQGAVINVGLGEPEDLSGNRLNKSPRWSSSLNLGLTHFTERGQIDASLGVTYTGSMFFDQFNHDFAQSSDYLLWNAYLSYSTGAFELRAFGKNLTDESYISGQFTPSAVLGGPISFYGEPRTVGIQATINF